MYQQYLKDPESVDKAWWDFFADYTARRRPSRKRPPQPTDARRARRAQAAPTRPHPCPASGTEAKSRGAQEGAEAKSDQEAEGARSARAAARAPDTRKPLKGAAARVVANMEASLAVPTATSVRVIPAKLLIDNRVVINNHLRRGRGGKVSFTHLIGYALVKALARVPGDEPVVRRDRRQAGSRRARARQPRPRHRPAEGRRHPDAGRAQHQERRDARLLPVLGGLRGRHPPRAQQQADRRRLRRLDDLADQPRHDRHGPLGAAADVRPGRDHRRRRDGVPRGVPGRVRRDARAARGQQGAWR